MLHGILFDRRLPGAETTTLEITHKLRISATTLCDERNKYILAQSFTFTPHRQKSRTFPAVYRVTLQNSILSRDSILQRSEI